MPEQMHWTEGESAERMAPRELIGEARDQLNHAYVTADPRIAVVHLVHAVDGLRRALEQMAPDGVDPAGEGDARTVELLERVAGSHDGWSAGLDPDLRDEIDEWAEARGRRA